MMDTSVVLGARYPSFTEFQINKLFSDLFKHHNLSPKHTHTDSRFYSMQLN